MEVTITIGKYSLEKRAISNDSKIGFRTGYTLRNSENFQNIDIPTEVMEELARYIVGAQTAAKITSITAKDSVVTSR